MKQYIIALVLSMNVTYTYAEITIEVKAFNWKENIPNKIVKEEGVEIYFKEPISLNTNWGYHFDTGIAITKYTGTTMWTNEKMNAAGVHFLVNSGLDYKLNDFISISPNIDFRVRTIDGINTVERMIEPGIKIALSAPITENQKINIGFNQPFTQYLHTFAGTFSPKTKHPHIEFSWTNVYDKHTIMGVVGSVKSWKDSEKKQYNHEGKNMWIYQPAITSKTLGVSINHTW